MESRFGSRRKTGTVKPILMVALGSFLLGGSGVGYYMWHISKDDTKAVAGPIAVAVADPDDSLSEIDDDTITIAPGAGEEAVTEAAEEATEAVERVEEQQGGLDQRLAAAEQRLALLDLQAQAAASNVARAEGLLIAFATRRALQRDQELGYLADQLRLRFGENWPNAVRTVIEFSRDPVRLDRLVARLEGLGPEIVTTDGDASWANFRRSLNDLFVIRNDNTPSPQPEMRLQRARNFLEKGQFDSAIGEVKNLPGAAKASDWIADAERFAAAMTALETLETAAVVNSDRLSDGAGNPITQSVENRAN